LNDTGPLTQQQARNLYFRDSYPTSERLP